MAERRAGRPRPRRKRRPGGLGARSRHRDQRRRSSPGSSPRRREARSSSASASTYPPNRANCRRPGPGALAATSLRIAGAAALAREPLLAAILAGFERWYLAWRRADGDPGRCGLRAEYTRWSGTIGRRVRVELPGGQVLSGLAVGVEEDGRLLVRVSPDAELSVAAGDVVHLR